MAKNDVDYSWGGGGGGGGPRDPLTLEGSKTLGVLEATIGLVDRLTSHIRVPPPIPVMSTA